MKDSIKTAGKLICMAFVCWWGMGCPIPANATEWGELAIAVGTFIYTGYKNFDFTQVARDYTSKMRFEKALRKLPQNKYAWAQDGGVDYTHIIESEAIEDNGITID